MQLGSGPTRSHKGADVTSINAGTIGIPETPAVLQASSTLFGVGAIGAAGAMGGNKPTGKLVENGGSSCM